MDPTSSGSQEPFHDSICGRNTADPKNGADLDLELSGQHLSEVTDPVLRLTRLLDTGPVDLAKISEEIRSQPHLRTLVMRLAASLLLSPESPVTTLEEATVMLGTDRLRVMAYMWSTRPEDCRLANFQASSESNASVDDGNQQRSSCSSASATPETLYIDTFLRWLGLDSVNPPIFGKQAPWFASSLDHGEFADLRNTLMRDFFAVYVFGKDFLHSNLCPK